MSQGGHAMASASVFEQILDYSNRAHPYWLYSQLREAPVSRQEDGSYVVSTYPEIVALLHDPRVSSDPRKLSHVPDTQLGADDDLAGPPAFIRLDPPEHDRIRRLVMYHYGPPHAPERIDGMRPELVRIVTDLIDGLQDRKQADIVEEVAHPFPVLVICRLFGVPREDESRISVWADEIVRSFGPSTGDKAERARARTAAFASMRQYLSELAEARRAKPGGDLLSGLVTDTGPQGPMSLAD